MFKKSLFLIIMIATCCFSMAAPKGLVLKVSDAITPPVAEYIQQGIDEAGKSYDFVVIKLDTPGGLYHTTRAIGQSILASNVPVITYVSPHGARAASAGTFILYASHIAAMAPDTHVGAATPVSITPNNEQQQDTAMKNKIMSDSTAYIRSLAQYRKRNVNFGIAAVTDAASLTAQEALKNDVIDATASNLPALLNIIDGTRVSMPSGRINIDTKDAVLTELPLTTKQNILFTITDPNITYLLLMAGIYGLLIELFNPGSIVPGTIGAVCLLIASYSLHILPINYAGLGLMVLGIAFLVAEAFITGFGIIGFAGIVALFVGSFFLYDGIEWAEPSIWVITSVLGLLSLGMVLLIRMNVTAHTKQPVSGLEALVGKTATVIEAGDGNYAIRIDGQVWSAKSSQEHTLGEKVIIEKFNGLIANIVTKGDINV